MHSNVAYHNHDVKLARVGNQLHCAVIDDNSFEFYFWIKSGDL